MAEQVPAVGKVLATIERRDRKRLGRLLDPEVNERVRQPNGNQPYSRFTISVNPALPTAELYRVPKQ